MALDTNIALGVKPIEQPNMLAQMGQMMQLRQAQQEYDSQNALRDAFSQGTDINDPAAFRRIAAINPKLAFDLRGKDLEQRQKGVETGIKINEVLGSALGGLVQNPTLDYARNTFSHLVSTGVLPPDKAAAMLAKLEAEPGRIKEYATMGVNAAISAQAKMTDATSRENARTTSGPGYLQAGIARERLTMEQAEQANIARILRGEPPVPTGGAPVAPMTGGGGGVAPMTGGGRAPVTAPMSGVAPVNALVPNAAPVAGGASMPVAPVVQPNVNALNATPAVPATANVNALTENAVPPQIAQMQTQISQLIRAGSPKAIAAADALIKQHNMLMPSQQIVQNQKGEYIRVDQRSGVSTPVIDASGQPLVGKLPPPVFESEYAKLVGRSAAERDVALVTSANTARENLPKLYETLDQIKTSDAITGFGANIIKNIEAARAKFSNDIKAGKKVADTEILDAMLGSDVFPMIQSLGIGAKGLDTPAEREYLRGVMTGTITMNKDALIKLTEIRKNIAERAIDLYNDAGTRGKLDKYFETQGAKFDFMYPSRWQCARNFT